MPETVDIILSWLLTILWFGWWALVSAASLVIGVGNCCSNGELQ